MSYQRFLHHRQLIRRLPFLATTVFAALLPLTAQADGLLVQGLNGQIITGTVSDDLTGVQLPTRTFSSRFPETYAWSDPGFHSVGIPPAGYDVLPVGGQLEWDFVPMRNDGLVSNLLYWDGQGSTPEDVEFGLLPDPNTSLTLFGRNNEAAAADGTDQLIPGKTIDLIGGGSGLRMHAHRFFYLDDNDGNLATPPADGVYLLAMQLRMDGFETSDPFYVVWGTLGTSVAALEQAAVPWVEQREDTLTSMLGDFNFDGEWDELDIDALVAAIADPGSDLAFDMNGDGQLNGLDITDANDGWLAVAGANNTDVTGGQAYLVGDANLDGAVDGQDFVAWNTSKFTATAAWSSGDFNASGTVDGQDFVAWNGNKFTSVGDLAVPEPQFALGLLLTCLPLVRRGGRRG
ncbi:MAG: hypothetical protein AAGF97_11460 [Planctomycetota bacterium]